MKEPHPNTMTYVDEVLRKNGLENGIAVKANNGISSARTSIMTDGTRLIEYRPGFFEDPRLGLAQDDRITFIRFILAHEIAHHINGHTISLKGGDRFYTPENELLTDAYAARYMKSINVTPEQFSRVLEAAEKALPDSNPPFTVRRVQALEAYNSAPALVQNLASCQSELGKTQQVLNATEGQLKSAHGDLTSLMSWGSKNLLERTHLSSHADYYIDAAVMTVTYDDDDLWTANRQHIRAYVQISYSLHAISDVPTGFFVEEYHTNQANTKIVWIGSSEPSDELEPGVQHVKHRLRFAMRAGERRTIITSAFYDEPWPLSDRKIHDLPAGPSEDVWCYPNDIEGELINDLTLVIRTHAKLAPAIIGDALRVDTRSSPAAPLPDSPIVGAAPDGTSMLSYRWTKVSPETNLELRIRWARP